MKYLLFIVLLVAVIFTAGCTVAKVSVSPETVTYQQPMKVTSTPVVTDSQTYKPIALFSAIPLSGTAPINSSVYQFSN